MATIASSVEILSECPEWDLTLACGPGHWTQADLEIFTGPEGQRHAHFYCSMASAADMWEDVKDIFKSQEVTSVSFRD